MHEDHNAVELHAAEQNGAGRGATWLIAAVTGRALAASASRGGHRVVVLDYFADRDCIEHALACRSVGLPTALRFDRKALLREAGILAPLDESAGLVYGSGFEARAALLEKLAVGRRLFGNPPSVVRRLKDPQQFFPLLDGLKIPHPETRFVWPAVTSGWLAKESGGSGGVQVRPAGQGTPTARTYYQRLESGRSLSVSFLANRKRASIVGFNQQWTSNARLDFPFQFGGAVGGITLPRKVRAEIVRCLDLLVAETGLVGLNGLDFMLSGGHWSVLEVNPRPTATLELYDRDFPRGLFDWHLRSCRGELPQRIPAARAFRALSVVSATGPWESAEDFSFPEWCRDLPRHGLQFSAGDPICTVHASAPTPAGAVKMVRQRQGRMEQRLVQSAKVAVG